MVGKSKIDWQNIDWTKTNAQIAQECGRAYNTVAKMRGKLGKSHQGAKSPRKDKGISRPQPHLNRLEYQALATAKAKASPKAGRFESNTKAKTWTLKSPDNKTYTFTNLMHFVRTNPHLFDPDDVVWRTKSNGVEWCRASSGLALLAKRKKAPTRWKGWRLISLTKDNK